MLLLSVAEYCRTRELSRNSLYNYRRQGRLPGCFRKSAAGRLLVDATRTDYIYYTEIYPFINEGGMAMREKHRERPGRELTWEELEKIDLTKMLDDLEADVAAAELAAAARRRGRKP